jgi:hypothetical protein
LTFLGLPCTLKCVIPLHLHSLFWDVNPEDFDPQVFPTYTIGRILEYGDRDAIEWMNGSFTKAQIAVVIRTERRLSRRSANFWALVYDLSPNEVAALKLAS